MEEMHVEMFVATTGLYAGILALVYMLLSLRVSQARQRLQIDLGDGGNPEMTRIVRVHANFAEYVPLALILIGAIELNAGPHWLVHALGGALVVCRAVHAWGLGAAVTAVRAAGSGGTLFVVTIAAIYLIYQFAVAL
jgi:uncharacterized membrane protein YecN with MAPEG domain